MSKHNEPFWRQVHERIAWLRGLTTDNAAAETILALNAGVPEEVLWAANALTATKYINNQAHNLLGFVSHAMIGCEDARQLSRHQTPRIRHLLLAQAIWQTVFDLHDPCLTPYELLPSSPLQEATLDANLNGLRVDVRMGEYLRADHRLVGLEAQSPREALIDLLLEIGLEGMVTDDHTLISPVLVLGTSELLEWTQTFDMLRCTLRYSASFPRNFAPYDRALKLLAECHLEGGAPHHHVQPERIDVLRRSFLDAVPHQRPEIAARAMSANGYAPETVLAAVTLAAADMYLMAQPVPHEDFDAVSREVAPIHIGTSTNALRAGLVWMSPRTRALAGIQGGSLLERGPSVLNAAFEFVPFEVARPYPYAEDVTPLRGKSTEALLAILREACPAHDYRTATAAVRAYADTGEAPKPLIATLTEIACLDNSTLLHNFKHLNAMIKEFRASVHADRWNFLMAAARWMAWYTGVDQRAYHQAVGVMRSSMAETHDAPEYITHEPR
jgi:hypothetical protein